MNIERLNRIVRKNSGFKTFEELLNAHPEYSPTIHTTTRDKQYLANSYDKAQAARGDTRRAYRPTAPHKRNKKTFEIFFKENIQNDSPLKSVKKQFKNTNAASTAFDKANRDYFGNQRILIKIEEIQP